MSQPAYTPVVSPATGGSESLGEIIVCGFDKKEGSASPSGYCQKLEVYLRIRGLAYKHESALPYQAPKGKLPFMKCGKDVVPDSTLIIKYIEDRIGALDPIGQENPDTKAWQRYTEDFFYVCLLYDRWIPKDHYSVSYQETFSDVPCIIRGLAGYIIVGNIKKALNANGMAKHSQDTVELFMQEYLDAAEKKLGTSQFFGTDGTAPGYLDCIIYAFLVNSLGLKGNLSFHALITKKAGLLHYLRRMTQRLFPEYRDILGMLEASGSSELVSA